jgi:hypothetical protein
VIKLQGATWIEEQFSSSIFVCNASLVCIFSVQLYLNATGTRAATTPETNQSLVKAISQVVVWGISFNKTLLKSNRTHPGEWLNTI